MNNILTLETNKYAIKLDNFEGPLDLLCHLVDKNKMDINQIRISEITDQYIEYINKMNELESAYTRILSETEREYFIFGFKLGAKIMTEVYNGRSLTFKDIK